MRAKDYFISYHFLTKEGKSGDGYVVTRQKKYKPLTFIEIDGDLQKIRDDGEFQKITLINFGRFER